MHKRIKSFGYAIKGILFFIKTQVHARVHLSVALFVVLLGFFLNLRNNDWIVLIFAIAIVLTAEMFNTAIEEIVNFISPDYNKKAGIIKDVAAGAVFISVIGAVIVGILIFLKYF